MAERRYEITEALPLAHLIRVNEPSLFVMQLRKILTDGLVEKITLQDVAKAHCVSSRTLTRHLKKWGESYSDILQEIKKERAIRLLQEGDIKISAIGKMLGYRDPANFSKAFRGWMQCTPREYRNRINLDQKIDISEGNL